MKYMGSKRSMLLNGLGDILATSAPRAGRFVDLFAGSGAVAIHVATKYAIPVVASDLQRYSGVLTGAVLERKEALAWEEHWTTWYKRAEVVCRQYRPPKLEKVTKQVVIDFRAWSEHRDSLPLTKAYGGHYFCPVQATWLDALRQTLPAHKPARTVALASLLHVASKCAASPGHTAQPLQPGRSANPYIFEAWNRDVPGLTKSFFESLSGVFAKQEGIAKTADANKAADGLDESDLVFVDPPYSGVQYSRFYHVFESVARGSAGEVSGSGRNPEPKIRPHSEYSVKRGAKTALSGLLSKIAEKGARAILTFPAHACSNGLSGDIVRELSLQHFRITEKFVASKFSTLGGVNLEVGNGRAPRHSAQELILSLRPK
jgi:adenine-specific DNA-methyltransferase